MKATRKGKSGQPRSARLSILFFTLQQKIVVPLLILEGVTASLSTWSLPKHLGPLIAQGHGQDGSQDKAPPTAEHNSQSWSAEHLNPVSAAPRAGLCVARHGGSPWEAQQGWGSTGPWDMVTCPPHTASARCCRYAGRCVSTRKRRCRGTTILALSCFVSGHMQPDGRTEVDCRPQPVLRLYPCPPTLIVPVQLQNKLQDQDAGGARAIWPLGCHLGC